MMAAAMMTASVVTAAEHVSHHMTNRPAMMTAAVMSRRHVMHRWHVMSSMHHYRRLMMMNIDMNLRLRDVATVMRHAWGVTVGHGGRRIAWVGHRGCTVSHRWDTAIDCTMRWHVLTLWWHVAMGRSLLRVSRWCLHVRIAWWCPGTGRVLMHTFYLL